MFSLNWLYNFIIIFPALVDKNILVSELFSAHIQKFSVSSMLAFYFYRRLVIVKWDE